MIIAIDSGRVYLAQQAGYPGARILRRNPTAETAAAAVGCSPAEIAKSVMLLVGDKPVLAVTSGDTKTNSSRLKQATGLTGKVKLPDSGAVIAQTG